MDFFFLPYNYDQIWSNGVSVKEYEREITNVEAEPGQHWNKIKALVEGRIDPVKKTTLIHHLRKR